MARTRKAPQEPAEAPEVVTPSQDTQEPQNARQRGQGPVRGGTTRGATVAQAQATAPEPHPTGRWGYSPAADATGRQDKGLSQQAPGVLPGKG